MNKQDSLNYLLLIVIVCFSPLIINAQNNPSESQTNSFIELNMGAAHFKGSLFRTEDLEDLGEGFSFPGGSILYGQTFISKNKLIFEYEAGFAFPTVVTAKLGIGGKLKGLSLTAGTRLFPFTTYLQFATSNTTSGNWLVSFEINPLSVEKSTFSIPDMRIINIGYRWNL